MQIVSLFPTALGVYELGRDFTKEEIDFIKNQETRGNMGNTTSVDNNILDRIELKDLRKFVQDSVDAYFKTVYAPKNETGLRLTQSWCNYTKPGEFHHKHAHPNSFVSGVLYPQADGETDKIYFFKSVWQQLKTETNDFNPYNSDSWWMGVRTGIMYIFPSHLEHMVEEVKAKDARISLSFNTFPVGDWGEDRYLTGLKL